MATEPPKTITASLVLLPGAMCSSVFGLLDVLTVASFLQPPGAGPLIVQRVAQNREPVVAFQGIELVADATIGEVETTQLILVPSLMLDTQHWFAGQQPVIDWIRQQASQGARVASVCTGGFVLAEAGLLDGVTATTHWAFIEIFRQRYPLVQLQPESAVINHGQVLTAAAGMAWQDMLLQVLPGIVDENTEMQLRQSFLLQPHQHGQKPFTGGRPATHNDRNMLQAEAVIHQQLANPEVIANAIRHSGLHQRTFQRRFRQATGMTPTHYLQFQRMEAAKIALVRNNLSVEEISLAVGYDDSSFFRRLFRRHTGISPAEYRKNATST